MLTVLELEVNSQMELPPLNPSNTVFTCLLASFNRLGGGSEGHVDGDGDAQANGHGGNGGSGQNGHGHGGGKGEHGNGHRDGGALLSRRLGAHGRTLKRLHLGCNGLSCVGELLSHTTRLVELTLEGNRLASLPYAPHTLGPRAPSAHSRRLCSPA